MREGRRGVVVYLDLGLGLDGRIIATYYGGSPLDVIAVMERAGDGAGLRLAQNVVRQHLCDLIVRRGGPPSA